MTTRKLSIHSITPKQWYEMGMEAAKKAGEKHAWNELKAAYDDLA